MNPTTFKAKVPALMKQFMTDFDCTKEDAAAVFGNAGHESGGFMLMQELKPTVAGSRGGFGWFQWTGPRRRAFEAHCKLNNLEPTSDAANYGFLCHELRGDEKMAVPRMKAAKSLGNKVVEFELGYERAGVKHYKSREDWANIALEAFKAKYGNGLAPKTKPTPNATGAVVSTSAGTGTGAAAYQAGAPLWLAALIGVGVALVAFLIWKFKK